MDPFQHGLGNPQCDIPSLVAWAPLSKHKHTWFFLEKLANFIRAQVPHFGDFRNGIMPLDVHRGLDLGWYGHFALVTPAGLKGLSNSLVGFRESKAKNLVAGELLFRP
jgi:hypothetical protein